MLLTEALRAFGLADAEAVFLQHNENLTYRVGCKYLLRIHKTAQGVHVEHNPTLQHAELAFLRHLAGKGLTVQAPLAEAALSDGTMATLLTWLEGQSLRKEDMSPELLQQAGKLACQLHQAAQDFRHAGLRRYDQTHVERLITALQDMGKRYLLNNSEIDVACRAAQVIGRRLSEAAGAFIPIHADLSASNLILTQTDLAPIDFSLCGVGHPMHDLGILMGNIGSQAQRIALAKGYAEAGGHIALPLLDAGFALGLLEALVFHADNWPKESWFAPRLTRWANEMLRPLADGKALLNEEMYLLNVK